MVIVVAITATFGGTDVRNGLPWLYAFFLITTPLVVASSYRRTVSDFSTRHWRLTDLNAGISMLFAGLLLPHNPWLVCATLFMQPLLLVQLRSRVSLLYGPYPKKLEFNEFRGILGCSVFGLLLVPVMNYAPWLMVPLHGLAIVVHYTMLWYTRRNGMALSHDQHTAFWLYRFKSSNQPVHVWEEMQSYVRRYDDIPEKTVACLLEKLDGAALLQYFDTPSKPNLPLTKGLVKNLTDAVELRLRLMDPHIAAVFELYGANKNDAIARLKNLRENPNAKPDVLELPDLGLAN